MVLVRRTGHLSGLMFLNDSSRCNYNSETVARHFLLLTTRLTRGRSGFVDRCRVGRSWSSHSHWEFHNNNKTGIENREPTCGAGSCCVENPKPFIVTVLSWGQLMEGRNTGEILRVGRCSREGGSKTCWLYLVSFLLWCFNGKVNGSSGLFTHRSCVLSKKTKGFRGPWVLKSPRVPNDVFVKLKVKSIFLAEKTSVAIVF